MANTRQNGHHNRHASHRDDAYGMRGTYLDGNTVRRIQTAHELLPEKPRGELLPVSRTARRNRERAQSMSMVFVVFLAAVSVAVLFTCVRFLQLKSQITGSIRSIAALETEYGQLKADNDAYESQIDLSVDLQQLKKTAMERLGMRYPAENQVITYQLPTESHVRQYQEVPEAE